MIGLEGKQEQGEGKELRFTFGQTKSIKPLSLKISLVSILPMKYFTWTKNKNTKDA